MSSTQYVDGVTLVSASWLNDVDTATYNGLTSVAGQNTITATGPVTLSAYAANQIFRFIPVSTNTVSTTLNINSLGAKNILANGAALAGGEIVAGTPTQVIYTGSAFSLVSFKKNATRTVFTSGTSTYTTPTGATRINVRLVGGGGGGSGRDANNGSAGGDTTFGVLTGSGGGGGTQGGAGGSGGAAAGGDINISGGGGGGAIINNSASVAPAGANGGNSAFGGGGRGTTNATGGAAATNSGGGGGGAGGANSVNSGSGGGAGGYVEKLFSPPSATYSYGVGGAGNGGSAGGQAGGQGAAGIIIIDEYYD